MCPVKCISRVFLVMFYHSLLGVTFLYLKIIKYLKFKDINSAILKNVVNKKIFITVSYR